MAIKLTKEGLKEKIREILSEQIVRLPMHFRTMYDDIGDGLLINEGLIKTYPLTYVEKFFRHRFLSLGIKEKYFVEDEWKVVLILDKERGSESEINIIMNRFGYYLSYKGGMPGGNINLECEPKFQNTFTGKDLMDNGVNYLIHVSPQYNRNKILSTGLSPVCRNKEFNYPGRLYFFVDGMPQRYIQTMVNRLSGANDSQGNNGIYDVFNITLTGLENVKFNLDYNADDAVFTQENIPPTNIKHTGSLTAKPSIKGL